MSWRNALRQERARTSRSDWKAFMAMLARDAHVARRNAGMIVVQTFLQPLLFVFIFGRVMVRSGYMPESYKSLLLPGIMAISMMFTGIWAVAMPVAERFCGDDFIHFRVDQR